MSKGLEALKDIREKFFIQEGNVTIGDLGLFNRLNTIEKELKEYNQYKTIEEELGIDLITLFNNRPLSQIVGYVWYKTLHPKTNKEIIIKRNVYCFQKNGVLVVYSYYENYCTGLNIKDYGKTWALAKGELL